MTTLPDIEFGRQVAEEAMEDRCRILRDVPGPRDDTLDPVTGRLVRPSGDEATVYEGRFLVTETAFDRRSAEGGRTAHYRAWRARIPVSAPLPARNDVLLVLTCRRDSTLIGRRLRVTDVNQSSVGVTRRLLLEDEKPATVR
ncbi:MAG: DUF6093 family protein [Chloroflexi bacterium]|nr:DUF6093 family protein [Chloroflexota bacterium]